jgi:AcrR family transcriptional regulator
MTKRNESQVVRRRMAPDERREAILDAAHTLFMERGWEAVTIADVLAAADISKGGFYHHFTAKEDLLTGIVERMTRQSLAGADAMRSQSAGDALAKLKALLIGSVRWKAENVGEMRFLTDVLTKPGNDILYRRVFDATAAAVVPVLEDLIAEGAAEGVFDVADPRLTAEMIVGLSHGRRQVLDEALAIAGAGDLEQATEHLEARMRAEGVTCDRLLGLSPGTVPLSHPEDYRRMLAGLAAGAPAIRNEDRDV